MTHDLGWSSRDNRIQAKVVFSFSDLTAQTDESMQQALDQAQQRHAMSEKQHESWNTQDSGPVVSAAAEGHICD